MRLASRALFTVFTVLTALVSAGGGVLSDRIGRLPVLCGVAALTFTGCAVVLPRTVQVARTVRVAAAG